MPETAPRQKLLVSYMRCYQACFDELQLLICVVRVSLINRRAAAGATPRFVKVKARSAEPFNEAADAMASAAAELDLSRPFDLDPEAVLLPREHAWSVLRHGGNSLLRDHLTLVEARQGEAHIGNEMKPKDDSVSPAHIP